jgi:hypothetical protein
MADTLFACALEHGVSAEIILEVVDDGEHE